MGIGDFIPKGQKPQAARGEFIPNSPTGNPPTLTTLKGSFVPNTPSGNNLTQQPHMTQMEGFPGETPPTQKRISAIAEEKAPDQRANMVRYGIPGAAAVGGLFFPPMLTALPAALGIEAGITLTSEMLATSIEKAGATPEADSFMSHIMDPETFIRGGEAAAWDTGLGLGFAGLGKAVKVLGKPVLTGMKKTGKFVKEATLTQKMLGKLDDVGGYLSPGKPYSLSPGQLKQEVNGAVTSLEAIFNRALFAKRLFKKLDIKNISGLTKKHFGQYIDEAMADLPPEKFSETMEEMVSGLLESQGKIGIDPVKILEGAIWDPVTELIKVAPPVDLRPFRNFIKQHTSKKEAGDFWRAIDVRDSLQKKILPNIKKYINWAAVDAEDVRGIIKSLNIKMFKKGTQEPVDKGIKKAAQGILDTQLKASLSALDGSPYMPSPDLLAADLYQNAKDFSRVKKEILRSDLLKELFNKVSKTPSTVISWVDDAGRIDKIAGLKAAMKFTDKSARTMGGLTPTGKPLYKNFESFFEDKVRKPLRKQFTDQILKDGTIDPRKFAAKLDEYTKFGDEYVDEVFGPGMTEELKDLSTALSFIDARGSTNSLAISLIQGGQSIRILQLAAGAFAGGAALSAGAITPLIAGSAAIFVTPAIMTYVLTRPRLIRMFTDAVKAGPKSRELLKLSRELISLKHMENKELKNMSPKEAEFYNTFQPTGEQK